MSVGGKGDKGDKGDNGTNGTNGTNGKSAYQIYCDSVYANDGVPLSEAEWLATLTGANGKSAYEIAVASGYTGTEAQWLASLKGDKGDTPTVHEHTYNDEVTVIFDAGTDMIGLGYKTCTGADCDHIELVIIQNYSYMVRVEDGNYKPIAGATVTINGVEATTNEDGYAAFRDIEKGDYDVVVEKTGYGAVETYKTGDETDIYVTLYPKADINVEEYPWGGAYRYFEPVIGDKVGDSAWYLITINYNEDHSGWSSVSAVFDSDSNEVAKYAITVVGQYYAAINENTYDNLFLNGTYEEVIVSGETTITFDVDPTTVPSEVSPDDPYQTPVPTISTVSYAVKFERMEAHKVGGEETPVTFNTNETVSLDGKPEEFYYFTFTPAFGVNHSFEEIDENTTLFYQVLNDDDWNNPYYEYVPVTADTVLEGFGSPVKLKAISTTGNISFKVSAVYTDGMMQKPINMTLGTAVTVPEDLESTIWYSLDVSEAGLYTIVIDTAYMSVDLMDDNTDLYAMPFIEMIMGTYPIRLEAKTYYFKASMGSFDLTVRAYDETTDFGLSPDVANTAMAGDVTVESVENYTYYKYTATAGGTLTIDPSTVEIQVYSENDEWWYGVNQGQFAGIVEDGKFVFNVEEGQVVQIRVIGAAEGVESDYKFNI